MKGNVLRFIGLFLLITLTLLGIGIVFGIIVGLITALLAFAGPVLATLSVLIWVPFVLFMVVLGWALNSKAMGLVYQELTEKKKA